MTWLLKFWNWMSGKKTAIGAALLLISTIISQVAALNHFTWAWIPIVTNNLDYIGGLLTGGGLLHKAAKVHQANGKGAA